MAPLILCYSSRSSGAEMGMASLWKMLAQCLQIMSNVTLVAVTDDLEQAASRRHG